jgi:hypothetical protein
MEQYFAEIAYNLDPESMHQQRASSTYLSLFQLIFSYTLG